MEDHGAFCPNEECANNRDGTCAMRQAAMKHLPSATAQKKKLGFPVPTRVWLKNEKYYNIVKNAFTGEKAKQFFNIDVLMHFLDDHFSGKCDNNRKIWTIFVFLVWYDIYFNGGSHEPGDMPVIK